MTRRWNIAPPPPDEVRVRFPELHPVAVQLLANRGIVSQDAVDEFLLPDYGQDLHDPFLFRDMERACDRVWEAISRGERVTVHGDYDADGVTGSVVLLTTFRDAASRLGKDPSLLSSYIPHREKEGYGVRMETVEKLADEGTALMITVDCGISCAAEIARASERGIDTIVVDHHQVPERVPECLIIHPLVPGETYPYKSLAAVGVSFKFASAFVAYAAKRGVDLGAGYEKWLLDLVAIATVTDFMPLVGENRTLERYGLVVLNKTRRPGLRKIIESAGLTYGSIDTVDVGFAIGPRINAASRMEHARLAFDCLMSATEEEAESRAALLEKANRDRQRYTEEIMAAARRAVAEEGPGKKVRCIAGDGWSPGIVGLVAGKLVSELGVPVFVFGRDGDRIVGSGRSIPEFNVVAAMDRAKDRIARYGGHPQACGLTIEGEANYAAFKRSLEAYAEETLAGKDLRPLVEIDAELRASQVTWELVEALEKLEPFGEGNPRPKFLLAGLLVTALDVIGKNRNTVRLRAVGDLPKELKLIGFNFVDRAEGIAPGMRIDAVVEVGVNAWNGRKEIQLRLVDVRPAAGGEPAGAVRAERGGHQRDQ
jgi:single-stranded-DNA-specific exonuclease